jgi:hypothetical protein
VWRDAHPVAGHHRVALPVCRIVRALHAGPVRRCGRRRTGPLPTVSPSPRPGSANACSGTAENRNFYAALAASVAWDVYCAVLPPGWFVDSGSYRLSNGGQLSITYRGPAGARLVVREGSYCAGVPNCIPSGTDAGSARFGERDARLLDLGSGSWLVVVASAGVDVGWQATGSGIDGPALVGYTAAFARVDQ